MPSDRKIVRRREASEQPEPASDPAALNEFLADLETTASVPASRRVDQIPKSALKRRESQQRLNQFTTVAAILVSVFVVSWLVLRTGGDAAPRQSEFADQITDQDQAAGNAQLLQMKNAGIVTHVEKLAQYPHLYVNRNATHQQIKDAAIAAAFAYRSKTTIIFDDRTREKIGSYYVGEPLRLSR